MRQPAPQLMVPVVIVVVVMMVIIMFVRTLFFRADGVHRFLSVFFNLFDPLLVKLNCGQCQIFFMAKEEKNGIFRIEIIQNIAQMTNHYLVS
ncbi:hypothetical protein PXH59_18345 [Xenorhabdus sp. SF857]|uniref:hypothetical protein n=1 Tax=Xenorhabdus bakwenae TaxID=3026967 RepID=UPI00255800F5|nr:hypothetical protein [Xenorhabdus sp. SF857]WFQ79493.1 hypothetical protein PXH59_18345 [Xenorhabdus sp. SF857]